MLARVLTVVLLGAGISAPVVAQVTRPPLYSADGKERLARALELADVDDIRVLINWGNNDCELCRKFAETTRRPEVTKTRYSSTEYHVVNVDVGKLDKNLDLARQYGVELKDASLPILTVLDQHGKVIVHATAPDFMSRDQPGVFDPAKVAAFFTLHQATAPDAAAPFETAVKQAKAEGKLVFVWFSAPW
jgi:hypothetical protein